MTTDGGGGEGISLKGSHRMSSQCEHRAQLSSHDHAPRLCLMVASVFVREFAQSFNIITSVPNQKKKSNWQMCFCFIFCSTPRRPCLLFGLSVCQQDDGKNDLFYEDWRKGVKGKKEEPIKIWSTSKSSRRLPSCGNRKRVVYLYFHCTSATRTGLEGAAPFFKNALCVFSRWLITLMFHHHW